jgi:peptidoglycan/xylan/chitin deacetylase (PgdA/CDA1 family)
MRRRVRARLVPLAISFGLGPLLLAVGPSAYRASAPAHDAAARPRASAPALPRLVDRYRLAGCRDRGAAAYRHGPSRKEVAIGFDDGPSPQTQAFVEMLERNHAHATFFVIGRQLSSRYTAVLDRELRDGDAIGDHTFSHPDLVRRDGATSQLQRTLGAVRALSGYTPCVFRPPYGSYDPAVVRDAGALGLATVLWNVDPADYSQPGAGAIVRRVLAQVQPGSIIVSHDGGGNRAQTLAAYPRIIRALRARGYRIVTVPQLLGFRAVYVPCVRLCDTRGVGLRQLPRSALIESPRSRFDAG